MQAGAKWRQLERKSPVIASTRRGFALIPVLVALAITLAAGFYFFTRSNPGDESDGSNGPFRLVELANRDFDGSPALALTFSLPLDPRHAYDGEIQVFEMPPRDGEVTGTGTDGDNDGEGGDS